MVNVSHQEHSFTLSSSKTLQWARPMHARDSPGQHTGFPWFGLVRTGGVHIGSNRRWDQFPWFNPVLDRSCLLPIKYKFSVEYCLPFCRLLLHVSKMSLKWLQMFLILLINKEISSSGKIHTVFVAKFGGYVLHG